MIVNVIAVITILQVEKALGLGKVKVVGAIEKRNKKRNVTITDIELNDFILLSKSNCFYCGSEPLNKAIDRHRKTNEERCDFDYNGLDRIDSNFGYFKDNVVPCCKHCNTAKNTMTKEEFLKWVKKIYEHNFR